MTDHENEAKRVFDGLFGPPRTTPFPEHTDQREADIFGRSSTVDVARDLGIAVEDQGDGQFVGACPWCRSSSFTVYAGADNWICYGCSESGRSVLVLVCKVRDFVRSEGIDWLERRSTR